MDVRKCGRMEAKYIHASILPDFRTRTEHAEFALGPIDIVARGSNLTVAPVVLCKR